MSDFKNRLSKACEAARSNLKSAQSKMKLRYDVNAQDRNFEPGDKVLALLPIPGKPLPARYYGPYTVDKKLRLHRLGTYELPALERLEKSI